MDRDREGVRRQKVPGDTEKKRGSERLNSRVLYN